MGPAEPVETVAHVIQIALTPVFLFSGVATLLNVLSARLARVADQVEAVSARLEQAGARQRAGFERRLAYLRKRSFALDIAVILAALGGMSTLLAAGLLFVDGLRNQAGVTLFIAFGAALLLTVGALAGYLYEMMLASIGLRHEARAADKSGS
ncbi:MAG TPA: DUF2721 domain-containing protein [Roseiarcus sp.]|nr:DUF2721 domain-containing protein [Roseiarcus sp.]